MNLPEPSAFAEYRDAIALLRGTIPYKDTNPDAYERACEHCRVTWQAWQLEREANSNVDQDD
jgi:hypothetical protein